MSEGCCNMKRTMPNKDRSVKIPLVESLPKTASPSTCNRGRTIERESRPTVGAFTEGGLTLCHGDALRHYAAWDAPTTIVSDGGYGILGFDGDTSDHLDLPAWYEKHVEAWGRYAAANASLWFWNSEIGWAAVHPVLERHGWRYVECCVWNKGKAHVAGNVNTKRIRRFPVVTEVCVLYIREQRLDGLLMKEWLHREWKRTGLPFRLANTACGVANVATRKYLILDHLWYFPPPDAFEALASYANQHGDPVGKPYFSVDGKHPLSGSAWSKLRSKFNCPHGWMNVWDRNPVCGAERVKAPGGKTAAHLNQKPLDLMGQIISATTDKGDVVWEPFGGLFTGSIAANRLGRRSYAAEIDTAYFNLGLERVKTELALPGQAQLFA